MASLSACAFAGWALGNERRGEETMIHKDDRTTAEIASHPLLVVMTDRFMSGWGLAKNGNSVAAWACQTPESRASTERWVRSRGDALRVRLVRDERGNYRPRGAVHYHVYVVRDGHPSLDALGVAS